MSDRIRTLEEYYAVRPHVLRLEETDPPDTAEIRDDYVSFHAESSSGYDVWDEANFDRWLTEHDRRLQEAAWAEGQVSGFMFANGNIPSPNNPYSTE
jgi:hypothetical protein